MTATLFTAGTARSGFRRRSKVALTGVLSGAMIFGLAGAAQATTTGLPGYYAATGLTGARPNATRLSFYVSDQVSATVDVGTGNVMVTSRNLVLPG